MYVLKLKGVEEEEWDRVIVVEIFEGIEVEEYFQVDKVEDMEVRGEVQLDRYE